MKQSPSGEANRSWATQKIPCIIWNRSFITMFTTAHHLFLLYPSIPCLPCHLL